jgi:hypothetical protein
MKLLNATVCQAGVDWTAASLSVQPGARRIMDFASGLEIVHVYMEVDIPGKTVLSV